MLFGTFLAAVSSLENFEGDADAGVCARTVLVGISESKWPKPLSSVFDVSSCTFRELREGKGVEGIELVGTLE